MSLKKSWLVIPAVLALSLAGCSGTGTSADPTEKQSEEAAAHPVPGDYILANSTEPQNPLIPTDTNEVGGGKLIDLIFSGLVYYEADGTVQNEVAESIETEDSKVYTVKLKDDQVFTDGTPVTASSFVDAWNLGAAENHLSAYFFEPIEGTTEDGALDGADTMSGLEVIDDQTFTITLKQPESDFPLRLGYSAFYPLPQSTLDDTKTGGEEPIGNGPYKVGEAGWIHNERIELVPNELYNGDRAPKNAGIEFIFYPTQTAAYADLLSGQLDVLDAVPDEALATFEEELGDRAVNQPAAIFQSFTVPEYLDHFEGEEGILRRQALSMAINRDEITQAIFSDTRTPARDFTSPVIPGYDANLENAGVLDFNPEQAQELWAQADEIDAFSGTFELAYNSDGGHQAWVDAVANQLTNNLGIDAVGKPYPDFKSLRDEVTNRHIKSAFRTGWQADYPALGNFLGPLYGTGAGSNDGDYSNPVFDAFLSDSAAAPTVEEGVELLQDAQEVLLEDLPAIPLWYSNVTGGYSEAVSDVVFGWNSVPLYFDITK